MSFQFATARKIASLIKGLNRNIKIVLGGYHATVMYDEVCKSNEGRPIWLFHPRRGRDLCFNELLEAINGKRPIESVLGVSFSEWRAFHPQFPTAFGRPCQNKNPGSFKTHLERISILWFYPRHRKILSWMRHAWIELLHIVKEKRPKSIQELARLTKRDIKSSGTDIGILVSYKKYFNTSPFLRGQV